MHSQFVHPLGKAARRVTDARSTVRAVRSRHRVTPQLTPRPGAARRNGRFLENWVRYIPEGIG
jgi:hypothetical protein